MLERNIADARMKDFLAKKVKTLESRVNALNFQALTNEKDINDTKDQETYLIKDLQHLREENNTKSKEIKCLYSETTQLRDTT